MTMNDSWGYHAADDAWKSPKQVIRNLATCARDGGNYLLNIGPKPDGSIPQESINILQAVGRWTEKNGAAIYETDRCEPRRSNYCNFTRRGNTLYIHVYFWPGSVVTVGGLTTKVLSARLLADNRKVEFDQDRFRVRFTGLPEKALDPLATVIVAECDQEPKQDTNMVRKEHPRGTV